MKCFVCKEKIEVDTFYIAIDVVVDFVAYHPQCFKLPKAKDTVTVEIPLHVTRKT